VTGDGGQRRVRLAAAIRHHLTEMISRELKDPRVVAAGPSSVNHVELTRDLGSARIYVSFVGASEQAAVAAVAGLDAAAKFLRGPLGRRLGAARVPTLRFYLDTTADVSARLSDIVREDAERARAAAAAAEATEPAADDVETE
jgi:ribosome-binding factor A